MLRTRTLALRIQQIAYLSETEGGETPNEDLVSEVSLFSEIKVRPPLQDCHPILCSWLTLIVCFSICRTSVSMSSSPFIEVSISERVTYGSPSTPTSLPSSNLRLPRLPNQQSLLNSPVNSCITPTER
jgi:hypothetical protein